MTSRFFSAACAALATAAITASSLSAAPRRPDNDKPRPRPTLDVKAVANDNNAFALSLFQELRLNEGNLFFSPYSITSALGMTYAGARGATAEGMAAALHFSLKDEQLHGSLSSLSSQLEKDATANKYQLSVANQLWGDAFFKKFFLQSFLDLNKKFYGAGMETVDFKKSAAAASTINEWVSEKTNNKIKDLVNKEMFEQEDPTAMVLTNAIYFKGDWASKFEKSATKGEDFFVNKKDSIKADLMFQHGSFSYAEDADAQLLGLPYQGGSLQMLVLLPTHRGGLPALEKALSISKLNGLVSSMFTEEVNVHLPKFKAESNLRLGKPLKAMGMEQAFSASADLSGMADLQALSTAMGGRSALYLSEVVHKGFVEVNEEGSEAAAATAIIIGVTTTSVEAPRLPKEFNANHPFLYMIRDVKTGAILFMGRMQSPKA